MIKFPALYLILVFLLSCSSQKEQDKNEQQTKNDSLLLNKNNEVQFIGDSVEIPSFGIELNLSNKAEEKLRAGKETIIVAAYFSGTPKDTMLKEYVKNGEFAIGSREKELRNERVAKFEGIRFSKTLYDSLVPKSMVVLINVYSGRRSTDVNLLDCGILQDSIHLVAGKRSLLKGKLIGE